MQVSCDNQLKIPHSYVIARLQIHWRRISSHRQISQVRCFLAGFSAFCFCETNGNELMAQWSYSFLFITMDEGELSILTNHPSHNCRTKQLGVCFWLPASHDSSTGHGGISQALRAIIHSSCQYCPRFVREKYLMLNGGNGAPQYKEKKSCTVI